MLQCWQNKNIISDADRDAIVEGLTKIKGQIDKGEFPFSVALEDIHMNIEKRLTDDIGEAGGRLHTGRSRNDQCAVDLHMYVRKAVVEMGELIVDMQKALIERLKNTAMLSCLAIRIYNGHNLYCSVII